MLRILTLLLILSACATKPTKYGKYSKKSEGGYQDKTLDGNLRVVNFKANSKTKTSQATKYATFRAIEICSSSGFKLTHLLDTFDKTTSKTITRTSGGYPSYYYGMSPFYNRYNSFGFGFSHVQQSSWNETLKYPEVEVIFECAEEVFEPGIVLKEIPSEEMKHLIKDLHGGLQVERIPKEAHKTNLKVGDIMIYADGLRIQQNHELLSQFHKSKDHNINVDILRNGVTHRGLSLRGVDASEKILEAQNKVLKSVCKKEEVKQHKLCQNP